MTGQLAGIADRHGPIEAQSADVVLTVDEQLSARSPIITQATATRLRIPTGKVLGVAGTGKARVACVLRLISGFSGGSALY